MNRPYVDGINAVLLKRKDITMAQAKNLYEKVWEAHSVATLENGQTQLLIGTHLIHEVTSPQAFGMLRDLGLKVRYPHRTFATVDHIVPTDTRVEPFADSMADAMIK
jgi:3-isopropylmalate/(R)-2-methylmalate dehydratase large subunit